MVVNNDAPYFFQLLENQIMQIKQERKEFFANEERMSLEECKRRSFELFDRERVVWFLIEGLQEKRK